MIAGEIRWGTGYDNVLSFAYPQVLDDAMTWRQPAPGSREMRNSSGTSDAWVRSRDFLLAGTARHFMPSAWGGVGLQDFLDWAGDKNTFRFIPDSRYPGFYVDNCYLDSPFADTKPQTEQSTGWQSIPIVIRQQAYDFSLAQRGLMFEYAPGKSMTDPSSMLATFSRSSTANRLGRDGVLVSEAVNALRDRHFIDSTRTAIVEKASANLCLYSEDFGGAAWTLNGTPTRVAAAHVSSGISLDLIGDDDAGNTETYLQSIVFTGDDRKGVSIYLKAGTSTSSLLVLVDTTTGTARLKGQIAWSGGVPTVTMATGTYLGKELTVDGVYRLYFIADAITAAHTHSLRFYPASNNADLVTLTGTVYAGGMQPENSTYPTSYKKTTSATVARDADLWSFPFEFAPQALTAYIRFRERGSIDSGANARILHIGKSDDTASRLVVFQNIGVYRVFQETSAGQVASALGAPSVWGDDVELRVILNADGSVQIGQSLNAGAEIIGALSAALTLSSSWSGTKLWIGQINGAGGSTLPVQIVRIAVGTKTMAEMRTA
jgi:hypothetical protein